MDVLDKIEQAIDGMTFEEPLENIRELLAEETEKAFDTETSPDGVPWAELKPSTLKSRKRKGRKKLQQEDELKGSLVPVGTIDELMASTLEWGTDVGHAIFHDEGTQDFHGQTTYGGMAGKRAKRKAAKQGRKVRGMVKREFLGITDEAADKIEKIVADHAEKVIAESFM